MCVCVWAGMWLMSLLNELKCLLTVLLHYNKAALKVDVASSSTPALVLFYSIFYECVSHFTILQLTWMWTTHTQGTGSKQQNELQRHLIKVNVVNALPWHRAKLNTEYWGSFCDIQGCFFNLKAICEDVVCAAVWDNVHLKGACWFYVLNLTSAKLQHAVWDNASNIFTTNDKIHEQRVTEAMSSTSAMR